MNPVAMQSGPPCSLSHPWSVAAQKSTGTPNPAITNSEKIMFISSVFKGVRTWNKD